MLASGIAHKALTILLSLSLSFQGAPIDALETMVSGNGSETSSEVYLMPTVDESGDMLRETTGAEAANTEGADDTRDGGGAVAQAPTGEFAEGADGSVSEPVPQTSSEVVPVYQSGKLSTIVDTRDGDISVVVAYGEDACVPDGSALVASVVSDNDYECQRRLSTVLEVGHSDEVLSERFLDVRLECEGVSVMPTAPVSISVEGIIGDAIPAETIEAAVIGADGDVRVALNEITPSGADGTIRLGFVTDTLGVIGIAGIVSPLSRWQVHDMELALYGARSGVNIETHECDTPELEKGIEGLECQTISATTSGGDAASVWLSATPVSVGKHRDDEGESMGSLLGYEVIQGVVSERLFGGEGTDELVPFDAMCGDLLIAWDTGLRQQTLDLGSVTVSGMVPEGTHGSAIDVTDDFGGVEGDLDALNNGALRAQAEKTSIDEPGTLCAWDITLTADEQEVQPDKRHPLEVTITHDAIEAGADLEIWHVKDSGEVEVVEGVTFEDGVARFRATGFSTYVVVQATSGTANATSTGFVLKCKDSNNTVTTNVTFVDTEKKPLASTVTGTITKTYSGPGAERSDENAIDLHSFKDALDPSIADEYCFHRAYVHFRGGKGDQKNIRYVHVADDSNRMPGGSASTHRAFMYMTGIEQNRNNQEYNGSWYTLSSSYTFDPIFIEFYHVAPLSFNAVDERGDPVVGAEFTLFSDPECYAQVMYPDEALVATSDESGTVDFGRIPRGTYYMKETLVPESYRKTISVRTIVLDGNAPIGDVVHQDDDGSIILDDIENMIIKKLWRDGDENDHDQDTVIVEVTSDNDFVERVKLTKADNWTAKLENLDPNRSYLITEKSIIDGNNNEAIHDWIPRITTEDSGKHTEYYKASAFQNGRTYVLVEGNRALATVGGELAPVDAETDGSRVTSTVTDEMKWYVESVTADNVISLKNASNDKFLDYNNQWYLNQAAPLYVRHINNIGNINIYHRQNINSTTTQYLKMNDNIEATTDNTKASIYQMYRQINVKTTKVYIENDLAKYPVKIKNIEVPSFEALSGMKYSIYAYQNEEDTNGTCIYDNLEADVDGYLAPPNGSYFELSSGDYAIIQNAGSPDYSRIQNPIRFTVTRAGALKVRRSNDQVSGFPYSSVDEDGGNTYPLLQIPNVLLATVSVTLSVEGAFADRTREFPFEVSIPEGVTELTGTIDGNAVTIDEQRNEVRLAHGQELRLIKVPSIYAYTLTQTSEEVSATADAADGLYETTARATGATGTKSEVTVSISSTDAREMTLSGLVGREDDPARVLVTNTLANGDVPATGITDNASAWAVVVGASVAMLALLWQYKRLMVRSHRRR